MRVLLVDDHTLVRQALAVVFAQEPDCTVVAEAGSLAEARGVLQGVDVAVVDLDLLDGDGLEVVRELSQASPQAMVLVLTTSHDRKQFARAIEAGASAVLAKSARISDVLKAMRCLSAGEQFHSPTEVIELLRLASRQREEDRDVQETLVRLTPREREVLQTLADGLNDREIAERLHISPETVHTHMVNILSKLGVQSRLRALVFAVRHGVVTIA